MNMVHKSININYMKSTTIIYIAIGIIIIGAGVFYFVNANSKPGKYDEFAKCLTASGAKFYGAFWCPHCQNQKAEFGKSAKYLPYIECSTLDGKGQLQVCKDAGIESYPTWVFPDGTRDSGEISFEELSQKTNCPLP